MARGDAGKPAPDVHPDEEPTGVEIAAPRAVKPDPVPTTPTAELGERTFGGALQARHALPRKYGPAKLDTANGPGVIYTQRDGIPAPGANRSEPPMQNSEARQALRAAMAAWDGLTEEQRIAELERAATAARQARRPRWLERAAGGPNFGGARTADR